MNEYNNEFEQLLKQDGIPTTEAEFNSAWLSEVEAQGSVFTNNSEYSPFWRIVNALITKPAFWLVQFVIGQVLPQSFVKTATGVYLEILGWGYGIDRKQATKAKGEILFTRLDTVGQLTIPEGVEIQTPPINNVIYSVKTTAPATFENGQATITAIAEATKAGTDHNFSGGYYSVMVEPVPGVSTVSNPDDWLTVVGSDKESDDELRARIRNQFSAVNQWHTDAVYRSIITTFEGLSNDNVYFQHEAPRGPGTADAYILLDTGNPDPAFIAAIQSEITDNENHGHGDDLMILAMPETQHDIVLHYWTLETLTTEEKAELNNAMDLFIRAAFRENTYYSPTKTAPFSRFSFSRLTQELHREFPGILSLEFQHSDIVSAMQIPRLNSLTLTEQ